MKDATLKDKFIEEELEKAIISLFEEEDYTYISGDDSHRRYEEVFKKVLEQAENFKESIH